MPGKGRLSYAWAVLAACLLIFIVSSGMRLSFGVFFKSFEDEFGWTRAVTSGVFSVSLLLGSLFTVVAGWLSDRYGPRLVLSATGALTVMGLALSSLASTLAHFYLSYGLLLAAGTGTTYLIVTTVAARWFPRRRGLAIGIVTSGMGLGTMIASSGAGWLVLAYGWRPSFLVRSCVVLLIWVPLAQLLRSRPPEAAAAQEARGTGSKAPPAARAGGPVRDFSLAEALRTRNMWVLFCIWFFAASSSFIVLAHVVRHGIDLGFTELEAASVLSVLGAASIAGRILLGRASDSLGRKHTAALSMFLMATSLLYLLKAASLLELCVFAGVFGFFYGGAISPVGALIAETFGLRHMGSILGVIEVGWAAGSAVGPAFAGYVFDVNASYAWAFVGGAAALLVTAVLVYFVRAPKVARQAM